MLAAAAALLGPRSRRVPRALLALAGFGIVALWVQDIESAPPNPETFVYGGQRVTLAPGTESVFTYDATHWPTFETQILLFLDGNAAANAWPGENPHGGGSHPGRIAEGTWLSPWTAYHGERTFEGDGKLRSFYEALLHTRALEPARRGPLVVLANIPSYQPGKHTFRVRWEKLPAALHGTTAHLSAGPNFAAYTSAHSKREAGRSIRLFLLFGCIALAAGTALFASRRPSI